MSRRVLGVAALAVAVWVSAAGCAGSGPAPGDSRGAPGWEPGSVEHAGAITDCLAERGLEVEVAVVHGSAAIGYDNRVVTDAAFDAAYALCIAELESAGVLAPPRSDPEAMRELFGQFAAAAGCLEDLGYDVAPAPSVEVFVDSRGAAWSPFDAVPADQELRDEAYAMCGF